jgi:hypothetical protein
MYPAEHLPPSTLNPVESLPVELPDGTVVHWVGKWSSKKEKNVYKSVARMFKGTIAERKEAQTLKDREERLATMERRIAEWKKVGVGSGRVVASGRALSRAHLSDDRAVGHYDSHLPVSEAGLHNSLLQASEHDSPAFERSLTIAEQAGGQGWQEVFSSFLDGDGRALCIMHHSSFHGEGSRWRQ